MTRPIETVSLIDDILEREKRVPTSFSVPLADCTRCNNTGYLIVHALRETDQEMVCPSCDGFCRG